MAAARAKLGLTIILLDAVELIANNGRYAFWLGQNIQQVFDFRHHVFVFADDFVLFQAGQALQTHLQNFLGLDVA